MVKLNLAYGLNYEDLYSINGLKNIQAEFLRFINPVLLTKPDLIEIAPHVEDFIAKLFNIEPEVKKLQLRHNQLSDIIAFKRQYILRKSIRKHSAEEAEKFNGAELRESFSFEFSEENFANNVAKGIDCDVADKYIAWACLTNAGRNHHKDGFLFKIPRKYNGSCLVDHQVINGKICAKSDSLRHRKGFDLTDHGHCDGYISDQVAYCIWCHHRNKDTCSKGMPEHNGCPLGQKISEMNELRASGHVLGALAVITIDNPLVAATGYRICNDCMKACIFQKQDPVDIPSVETAILKDVLNLPWGFEIYSLLTRWNPMNFERPLPKKVTNKTVLISGMGPAGFNLAHHLIQDGHNVIAIDGLKIEPLEINGPIIDINDLFEPMGERISYGFGGVAEYGITARWNKNFLKIVRLLLQKRDRFHLNGGTRLGSTIGINEAFSMGIDHVAICHGAGKPNFITVKNFMAKGVRMASDFLMALQLTGAAKQNSLANLQIRMPIVVVGGGLTAVDCATESLAYYPVQVEKFYSRYIELCEQFGVKHVEENWSNEEKEIAAEFIEHAKSLRAENNHIALLQKWGGSSILYRQSMEKSPAYRLNHEELTKALEEGIYFIENITPDEITIDKYGNAAGIIGKHGLIEAKTIIIAAGTKTNTTVARDLPEELILDNNEFKIIDRVITRIDDNGQSVSFFGDTHPDFSGNVVKAMASAKYGYPIISQLLEKRPSGNPDSIINQLDFSATVQQVNVLGNNIVEIIVQAPSAAKKFKPGQFFRFQNFEASAIKGLAMEGIALTGSRVNGNLISLIILEMGGSSSLCRFLKPGEKVVLMGPTGSPSQIYKNANVILAGGGLGNAVLFSIGKAMRDNGCYVTYFAAYRHANDVFKREEIEKASDRIIWCIENGELETSRQQDITFKGNIVQAMQNNKIEKVEHILAIGSDKMMQAVDNIRRDLYLEAHCVASINSPMQCMMREICAQCLQRHVDPQTGKEYFVFSCVNQDQDMDSVDFESLSSRLAQNSLAEKITNMWVKYHLHSQ